MSRRTVDVGGIDWPWKCGDCGRWCQPDDDSCTCSKISTEVDGPGFSSWGVPPQTKDTNPKDAAATTRLDLSLFPSAAVAYGALAMTEGDLKYGGYNYRAAGVQVSVYIAACGRHLAKYYNGEDVDPVTRVPHLANALACIAVVIDSIEQGNVNDDRPPKQDVGGLLRRMEENVKHLHERFPPAKSPGRYREKAK